MCSPTWESTSAPSVFQRRCLQDGLQAERQDKRLVRVEMKAVEILLQVPKTESGRIESEEGILSIYDLFITRFEHLLFEPSRHTMDSLVRSTRPLR